MKVELSDAGQHSLIGLTYFFMGLLMPTIPSIDPEFNVACVITGLMAVVYGYALHRHEE